VFPFTVKYGTHSNESWSTNAANTKDSRFHHFQNVMCITDAPHYVHTDIFSDVLLA